MAKANATYMAQFEFFWYVSERNWETETCEQFESW